ncbi:MAG: Deoxyribodipyrimidine photolyase [uncultured Solirubrobacteraceae bacterium]|uniref:Deoxyribodipyrimidine photolyase n=1 Tax=uncultured Solirubrobacteraceae bacterium TaxID=1162706 RepID=A0A6J4SNQ6_9ACTN|nr:MAG: Deoxyribodipyrimidine photolyase [uncultured Solirubrobacteraceae bacterium]
MTALVWFRRDLRVFDHPSLAAAMRAHDRVVPVFVLDARLIHGRFPSPARTEFLLAALRELRDALRDRGGDLIVRHGRPEVELVALAAETGSEEVFFASDVSPFAMSRDFRVEAALREAGIVPRRTPGNFVADVGRPRTADGRPFSVFSPFWRRWRDLPRRAVEPPPDGVGIPSGLEPGVIPTLGELGLTPELSDPMEPGEKAGRRRLDAFLADGLDFYVERRGRLSGGTSELSPYIHFGCLSAREIEARVTDHGGEGAGAFSRQLAWRDFYAHVLLTHPGNAHGAFKPQFDALEWSSDDEHLAAWKEGRTGFPVVDAGMRQLAARGWMHNRARLIVASFLTKDLHIDYRVGEAHFMRLLLCGDEAQNNGNWQWISSVGVDPQPFYRRIYNPVLQQKRHDPDGAYVRRWVPELRGVPLERLAEPWTMSPDEQREAGCVIGRDYPAPIVDHRAERALTLDRYRAVTEG